MQWPGLSLLIPFAYLAILVSSLATFSSLYRARKSRALTSLSPYFPSHASRNVYLSLLHLPDTDPSAPKIPESVLRAALLARAVEDIGRIMNIRTRKPALSTLLARGTVGDEIWQRLVRAEQEIEIEIKDVVAEANALQNGWGQSIFQSANEMYNNAELKRKIAEIRTTVEPEKQWWAQKRENARRELEGEVKVESVPAAERVPAAATEKMAKPASSDEDTVLVETPAIETEVADSTGTLAGGGKNKKKHKKK